MTYLVDVNVLSEPTRIAPNPKVIEWLAVNERDLVVDAIILGELRIGILALRGGHKRARLEAWFETVVQTIDCLPWDSAVSMRWAHLVVELKQKGRTLPVLDSMIAATALVHGLILATHNIRDFRTAGIQVVDPFD
jgi:predicted nucleic acid-binding protein